MSNFIIDWQSNGAEGLPGKNAIVLGEQSTNSSSTSLTLTGQKLLNYGEIQQENFIRLLENFASKDEPPNKTIGQLWFYYIGSTRDLRIWTGTEWRGMSITGPAGAAGPIGPRGEMGPPSTVAGPAGFTGPAGPTGLIGLQGFTGPVGQAGPKGPQGPTGLAGVNALAPSGPQGPQGPQGLPGPQGPTGPSGVAGQDMVFNLSSYFTFNNRVLGLNIPALAAAVAQNVTCADYTAAIVRCAPPSVGVGTIGAGVGGA